MISQEKEILVEYQNKYPDGFHYISIDEVGRGSLFGPVTVGGVLFHSSDLQNIGEIPWHHQVNDSKQLSIKTRNELYHHISQNIKGKVAHVSVAFIERYNINKAIQYGVYRLVRAFIKNLREKGIQEAPALVFLDGNYRFAFPQINMKQPIPPIVSIVKGDTRMFTIACASILAKVTRDEMIAKAAHRFPDYGLEKNAGYGTSLHREAITRVGPTKFHRKTYLKKIVNSVPS